MNPHDQSGTRRDAELLERYVCLGDRALNDPDVAAFVAANPSLVREVDAGLTKLRRVIEVDTGPVTVPSRPLHAALPQLPARRFAGWSSRMYSRTRVIISTAAMVAVAIVVHWSTRLMPRAEAPARTFTTTAGKRAEITLRDGTRVILAPRSVLTMRGSVATLTGQAFFMVTHRTDHPLIVRTEGVTTRVLGTAFEVRRYPGETETRVTVTEGKVAVSGTRSATVTAGTMVRATDSTITAVRVDDITVQNRWMRGQLVFRSAPVVDVLAAVERWYGVTFRIMDSVLTADRLTMELDANRSRGEILAALQSVLEVQMTPVGDTIVLTPRRGNASRAIPRKNPLFTPSTGVGR